jgi:hypothetical protein
MIEFIYASAATATFTPAELATLLASARQRNEENDVTGVLLYHRGSFLQVLEGDERAVDATVQRIQQDRRHAKIVLLRRRVLEQRNFADWRMGFLELTPASQGALEGFSDFLRHGALGLQQDSDAVKRVLDGFREGRYRQSIS